MDWGGPWPLGPPPGSAHVRYRTIPDSEEWRVNMCKELLNVRENDVTVPGFSSDELEELLGYLCSQ